MDDEAMKIISRKEAKALGLKRYFTGKPCKHGHVCERTSSSQCLECHRKLRFKWVANNRDKARANSLRYRKRHQEKIREKRRNYTRRASLEARKKSAARKAAYSKKLALAYAVLKQLGVQI